MFPEQLKKILDLIKKTGDRVIIFDGSNPDDSYVVMDFNNYAAGQVKGDSPLINVAPKAELSPNLPKVNNLTEEDLTDKINREISVWKNGWQIPPIVKDKAQEVE